MSKFIIKFKLSVLKYFKCLKLLFDNFKIYSDNSFIIFLLVFLNILIKTSKSIILIIFPKIILDFILNNAEIRKCFILIITNFLVIFLLELLLKKVELYLNSINKKNIEVLKEKIIFKGTLIKYELNESQNYLNLKENIINNIDKISIGYACSFISNFLTNFFTIIGILYLLFDMLPLLLIVIPICCIIKPIIKNIIEKISYDYYLRTIKLDRKYSHYFGNLLDHDLGKDIRLYKMQDLLYEKADNLSKEIKKYYQDKSFKMFKYNSLNTLFNFLEMVIFYFYIILKVIRKTLSISDFAMYINAISKFSLSISSIINSFIELSINTKYIENYYDYMNMCTNDNNYEQVMINNFESLEFRNVSFKYPDSNKLILKNVNFKIYKNEKISLVGLNGSGKTTIIKLILRMYKPTYGAIYINDININYLDKISYYNMFSVIFQDYKLFANTIKENIIANNKYDNVFFNNVINDSGVKEVIEKLPQKEYTNVTKKFYDDGINFSGGESQKLAFARCLYRNSDFIILDEPTASLDPISEYKLYCDSNKLFKNKTCIYISHRMSNCKISDRIIVIENGSIIQIGNHNELVLEKDKLYYKLFNAQLKGDLYE